MGSVQFPLMWRKGGQVLVPAPALSSLLRQISEQLVTWPEEGADPGTVRAVRSLLGQVADQIDVDCIAVASEMDGEV